MSQHLTRSLLIVRCVLMVVGRSRSRLFTGTRISIMLSRPTSGDLEHVVAITHRIAAGLEAKMKHSYTHSCSGSIAISRNLHGLLSISYAGHYHSCKCVINALLQWERGNQVDFWMLSFGCLSEAPNRQARNVQFGFNLPRVQTNYRTKLLASRTVKTPRLSSGCGRPVAEVLLEE